MCSSSLGTSMYTETNTGHLGMSGKAFQLNLVHKTKEIPDNNFGLGEHYLDKIEEEDSFVFDGERADSGAMLDDITRAERQYSIENLHKGFVNYRRKAKR